VLNTDAAHILYSMGVIMFIGAYLRLMAATPRKVLGIER